MRILVVGDGKVGHTVAEQLTREGHDVVIIDKNEDVPSSTSHMISRKP